MNDFFQQSLFGGIILSVLAYELGLYLKKKFRLALFNPLLISILVTLLVLLGAHISYDSYYVGAQYLSYLLTPATVCLAIPLYEQFSLLKKNWVAVVAGICSGVLSSLCSIFVMALIFRLEHEHYVTLLPKSITTAIGMGVADELGGFVPLAVASIVITGVLGNIIAESVLKFFHITEPIAKGVAIGSASHAIGTTKAMEMGETEGAMSSLSIAVCGLLTVLGASIFSHIL